MNAVEIEAAVSELAQAPFDAAEFPFAFLAAFGNKDTALKRLRAGNSNNSDIPGGVLQSKHIHLAVCPPGQVSETLTALLASPATAKARAKFVLATDGLTLEAKDLLGDDLLSCDYPAFADHFGFFLPLAGISTIQEIKDNPIDVRATGRLNKLYVELLRDNPDWATAERRSDLNHFMARTCARRTSAMTRCWSAFKSAGAFATTPSGWRGCSSRTPAWQPVSPRRRPRPRAGEQTRPNP